MAFSPFRAFRKHQKAFFAGLTIVCMLTFVLAGATSFTRSGGRGGDFFSWVGSLIGGSQEPKVALLYGKPVYRAEIFQLRSQRQLANRYMEILIDRAEKNFSRSFQQAFLKLDESTRRSVQKILENGNWRPASQARRAPENQRRAYLGQLSSIIGYLTRLEDMLIETKKDPDAIHELKERLQQEFWQIQRVQDPKELFFGGTVKFDDLLDFMIWKHEADRRGIQLTWADVGKLITRETGKNLSQGDYKEVAYDMRRSRDMNAETLRTALTDEFRVRIAKAAVLGEDGGSLQQTTTSATPYEFWQFYRDQRTENLIAVLPISVRQKDFLDQAGQPKEEELKTLHDQGKDTEYDPGSDKPGFKVPPRIGVEWVSARADSEHYRKAAEIVLAATQATLTLAYEAALSDQYDREEKYNHRLPSWTDDSPILLHDSSVNRPENVAALVGQLATGGTQPQALSGYAAFTNTAAAREMGDRLRFAMSIFSGSTPTPLASAALTYFGAPKTEFLPMSALKNQLVEKLKEKTAHELMTRSIGDFETELQKQSNRKPEDVIPSENFNRPEVVASMIGGFATGSTLGRPQFTAPLLAGTPVAVRNVKILSQLGADLFLTGTQPSPFTSAALAYREQHRNVEVLRRIIDTAVAKYSFQHGSSQKLRTRFDIGADEGLKPLKDSYDRFRANHSNAPQDFASLFWSSNPFLQMNVPYLPLQWPREQPQEEIDLNTRDQNKINRFIQQFQMNQMIWSMAEQPFLFWKTEDKPAYVPTLEQAKDKVIAWWKFDKARQLAEKEAEQVMAEAKGKPDPERRLKDGSKHSERSFFLTDQNHHDGVAKLVKRLQPLSREADWEPFKFSKDQIEYPPSDLDYPPSLVEQLLAMKDPGKVMVFHDRPKAIYYVAALAEHRVPSTRLFYKEYDLGAEPLLRELEESTHYRREFEKNLLAQLREEARLEIIEENRELVDVRTRSDDE
jgi:hypothetical protein